MSKDVINVDGKDVIVREDTAKAFRGVKWALVSIAAFVVIAGIMFLVFFTGAAVTGDIESPSQIQKSEGR